MSTVKIRAGSLFRTPLPRIEATGAAFRCPVRVFLCSPQNESFLHRMYTDSQAFGLRESGLRVQSRKRVLYDRNGSLVIDIVKKDKNKAPVEVCPLCNGTGWKTAQSASTGRSTNDRRVTRCDCQLRARAGTLMASARIPRRYEHCELTNYDTDFPARIPSLADAHFMASNFAKKCDPRGDKGLLIIGKIGTGKTHLAVGSSRI